MLRTLSPSQVCTYSLTFNLLSILFCSSWQAATHTWVNTLAVALVLSALSATDEDHWLWQRPQFFFIPFTAGITGLSTDYKIHVTSPAPSMYLNTRETPHQTAFKSGSDGQFFLPHLLFNDKFGCCLTKPPDWSHIASMPKLCWAQIEARLPHLLSSLSLKIQIAFSISSMNKYPDRSFTSDDTR